MRTIPCLHRAENFRCVFPVALPLAAPRSEAALRLERFDGVLIYLLSRAEEPQVVEKK
jgi:hypothetical protein